MITQSRLKELLRYNPETGIFNWIIDKGSVAKAGTSPLSVNAYGYARVYVDGRHYLQHRLAWFYMTGSWPTHGIDHINGNRLDNRFCNLREATQGQNMKNIKLPKTNTSGAKGAFWHKRAQKWMAQIKVDGRLIYLGLHPTMEAAADAYKKAAVIYHGEFARVD